MTTAVSRTESTPTDQSGFEVLPTPHSSYVSAFRYDKKHSRLEVTYKVGGTKTYENISPQVWIDLQAAPSKGRYLSQAIDKTYRGESNSPI